MIKTNELKAEIVKKGYTQQEMAKLIGISPKTFYEKMKKGVFGSNEIQLMIRHLDIKDPIAIFFANE